MSDSQDPEVIAAIADAVAAARREWQQHAEYVLTLQAYRRDWCGEFNLAMWQLFPEGPLDGTDWRMRNGMNCKGDVIRDADGFDLMGFNRDGYDREGYDRDGFHRETGLDREGFDRRGFNAEGITRDGYNHQGYDSDGYNRDGYDRYGFDCDRRGSDGLRIDDPARYCYCIDRYDAEGFNPSGQTVGGVTRARLAELAEAGAFVYDSQGYRIDGFDRYERDRDGYDREDRDRGGYDRGGIDAHGFGRDTRYRGPLGMSAPEPDGGFPFYDPQGFDHNGYHQETGSRFGPDGFDRRGLDLQGHPRP